MQQFILSDVSEQQLGFEVEKIGPIINLSTLTNDKFPKQNILQPFLTIN